MSFEEVRSYEMPKIYRAMEAANKVPIVGDERNQLGVRPVDITPDEAGYVSASGKGMSVNPALSVMMSVHLPRRWRNVDKKFKAARGEEPVEVFTHGEGEFVTGTVAPDLNLNPTSATHGVVEPTRKMKLDDYKKALASTLLGWQHLNMPDGS